MSSDFHAVPDFDDESGVPGDIPYRADLRKRQRGAFAIAIIGICLLVLLGLAILAKPDIATTAYWQNMFATSDDFDTLYQKLNVNDGENCAEPENLKSSQWNQIHPYLECIRVRKKADIADFKTLLAHAGGTWHGPGRWSLASSPRAKQVSQVWKDTQKTRTDMSARLASVATRYSATFFRQPAKFATGWRFAVWRCRCNLKAEYILAAPLSAKLRLFVSQSKLIKSNTEAQQAVAEFRSRFTGSESGGQLEATQWGAAFVDLVHGLAGGGALSKPYTSQDAANEALNSFKSLHAFIGFEIDAINARGAAGQ